ncbi:type I DNA topoisomerase [Mycoplasmoides genitalium]|uniref:DNA topoisomerase 1 n=1 Tax=Mycoplasma genitalium (strain ATCC 33530 / DSM 19775 / NCTC 10195 / G37) TaxID=243273 RepID=TOP1_MYCGE|nr:type I DNA topoisomerase [Mycoplasmoides genitalium]P47368.1 RecName: Full=DNA topoisomerase 1; AltName: Full=DNA topoisomerase I; AltName: Full=Omega-protein; AltName: Full=Relaxing enzyme; AltName: Full=Swivelase; AltName: Full=Untwisting enzyme [Mycoplasmoides genitalium G37]AAC71340.1 DNA topoisomerase I [Mycoplasmoides genitalium G37]ABY79425.1 DNA topoisomerase I [synthetic Mycoplasma genitalium JCVI-1.0]AFQ02939.1 DNA topoisomerase I [Mycoplasmoides genitalium M2321]
MIKNLVVIESPNKVKTLKQYLPSDEFEIVSTVGHIREMVYKNFGFDENTYTPIWEDWTKNKQKNPKQKHLLSKFEIIKSIKAKASDAQNIFLASDPDREGEAISWHVYDLLDQKDKAKCKRITFNEITKKAVVDALKQPRNIDLNWVESQFARQILDRMIGFRLSRLLNSYLQAKSAGRVQSVALRFLEEREKEIAKFVPRFWWTVDVLLNKENNQKVVCANKSIPLVLREINPELSASLKLDFEAAENVSGIDFLNEASATRFANQLTGEYEVYFIDEPKIYYSSPNPVYTTASLQKDAINKLGWSSKKVTMVAQRLYEGISVNGKQTALISYPRTDSIRISNQFQSECEKYIEKEFGSHYLADKNKLKRHKKDEKIIQDAHEGIHPTYITITPNDLKNGVKRDEFLLYRLIWIRTVASLMADAKTSRTIVRFINQKNKFYTSSKSLLFDGYQRLYEEIKPNTKDELYIDLSKLKIGDKFSFEKISVNEHKTNPPPRYTQASLIEELEKSNIGRPSTYNTMASVNLERGYANLVNRFFYITELGEKVNNELSKHFGNVINKEFTKKMEKSLDEIAENKVNYQEFLKQFWTNFKSDVKLAENSIQKVKKEKELVERDCPKCNQPLVYRYTKRGNEKFVGCSDFPKCKYSEFSNPKPKLTLETLDELCPECNNKLVKRRTKFNAKKTFIGCSNFPNCRFIKKDNAAEFKQ